MKNKPADFQEFMNTFVDSVVNRTMIERGKEISTVEVGPRAENSTKFEITPSPVGTFYSISFEDVDTGLGVFSEVEIIATGAYKFAKGKIQKVVSQKVADRTVSILNEIYNETSWLES